MNKKMKKIICIGLAGLLSVGLNAPVVKAGDTESLKEEISFYSKACSKKVEMSNSDEEIPDNFDETEIQNLIEKMPFDENKKADKNEDVLVGKSIAVSTAAKVICNYIQSKGEDFGDNGRAFSSYSYSTKIFGSIIYYKGKNELTFTIMPASQGSSTYGHMVMFDYDLSAEEVKNNVCFYMMPERNSDESLIAGAPFTLNYHPGDQISATILRGTRFSAADMSEVMTPAVYVGMMTWDEMLIDLTDGNYNIGNLGFSNYVAPRNPTGFDDVASDAYYTNAIKWAVQNKIASGTGSRTFSPNNPCTRAQIVTFLYNAYGNGEISRASNFSDVSSDKYYYRAVNWAVANGITSGTGNGQFSPNKTCTRAQAMTFLQKAKHGTAVEDAAINFTDVSPDKYYYNPVKWAVANGITSGTTPTTFSPNQACTRAQIVVFLYRAMR